MQARPGQLICSPYTNMTRSVSPQIAGGHGGGGVTGATPRCLCTHACTRCGGAAREVHFNESAAQERQGKQRWHFCSQSACLWQTHTTQDTRTHTPRIRIMRG